MYYLKKIIIIIIIIIIILRFNLSQTYFKGPGLAMFRLLLRTDYCIFLKEYLHLSSPTNAFTLSLGTVSWAPNVQAFSSSFILRFSTRATQLQKRYPVTFCGPFSLYDSCVHSVRSVFSVVPAWLFSYLTGQGGGVGD